MYVFLLLQCPDFLFRAADIALGVANITLFGQKILSET